MAADPLSDVLKTVRLTGATFFDIVAKSPWVAEQPPQQHILPKILPDAEHLIAYHVVTEGRCFTNRVGEEPIAVDAGEIVVYTRGDPHIVSSAPGMRAVGPPPSPTPYETAAQCLTPFPLELGTEGPVSARFICGFLACDASPFNPLLENLPPIIKVRDGEGDTRWLRQFISVALQESADKRAGGEGVLSKLSELMFIEVVRRYIEDLPAEQSGWLAGLRDPSVGKALSLMHSKPALNWTIEDLARDVGVSRSVLAERFAEFVGVPPMQYLAKWRMQIASGLLSNGSNLANIAAEIGYGSEAAFSRAFKKVVGVPPSAWRRRSGEIGKFQISPL